MRFSRRIDWNAPTNRLTLARQRRGEALLDLTETNPTRAAIAYPLDELAEVFARAARASYAPEPLGLRSAREALAANLRSIPEDLILSASTSEAYMYLFKLLCNAGDEIVAAVPSYPLLEQLAALELITLRNFALEFHRRWEVDVTRVRQAVNSRTRAMVMVNPNNPTGSFVTAKEQNELSGLHIPIISDEVFLDYPLEGAGTTCIGEDILTFALGGLSKSAGLPHYKLGWIRVSGPAKEKRDAVRALELIADNFLSVGTPVQVALPDVLQIAPRIRTEIASRLARNLQQLQREAAAVAAVRVLPVEGGWSAVIRVPSTESDEELALRLIEEESVLVYPGYFFDFDSDGYLIVSLLTEVSTFDEGVRRLMGMISKG